IVILIAGLVAETPVLIGFDILSILSVILIYLAETNDMITSSFDTYPPMSDVIIISVLLLVSGFLLNAVVGRISASYEQARQSALDLEDSNQKLQTVQGILEKQTNQLERRSRHQQASSEVMREAISALEIESLLPRLAALINERFNLYRMGIFLADSTKEWVVLRAADGEDVDEELISKFRLKIGEEGIVGYVAETGNSFFTDDVREEPKFVDDPKASDVRSEVALPLRVRENIIGVLDMQSRETAAFTDEDMEILQTLADQIAMAINNARLFEQVQESLETERRAYGEISRQAWKRLLGSQDLSFFSDKESTIPAGDLWRPEMRTALHTGEIIRGEDGATLAIPIKVRDQIIGVIDGRKPDDTEWTKEKITMLETLSEQLSTALESARLYEDTQRRATRERMASDITAKMRRAAGVERIVQTALDELYKALGTSRAFIQLGTTAPTQEETVEESK
ncbi:MAG: GAF domain-containing protein, partial [Chloroflexota bacterium]|nr:GAF domain-containing protein [Chloroflexota bacterium]